jgi:hypothetical protein
VTELEEDELMMKAIKKLSSYNGYIPSECMNEYHYQIYLKVAPPHELERDIISEKTMRKMIEEGAYYD